MSAKSKSGHLNIIVDTGSDAWIEALPEAEAICLSATQAAFDLGWSGPFKDTLTSNRPIEAGLRLTDDAEVHHLNKQYRGIDKSTNVLSFAGLDQDDPVFEPTDDMTDVPILLGDIIIAYETTCAEAKTENKSLSDHLSHLTVHGILHLLGYDHQSDFEAEIMEPLEISILATLGVSDPYKSHAVSPLNASGGV